MAECNKSFTQQFQDLLNRSDELVKVSVADPLASYLKDKLVGVSGVIFFEANGGVSGHQYVATLDLDYLDRRYLLPIEQQEIINFNLGQGVHNGNVLKSTINNLACLLYPKNKISQSSWSAMVAQDYVSGSTDIHLRWTSTDSTSGISIFKIEYLSLAAGDMLQPYSEHILSGTHYSSLQINEVKLNIPIGVLNENDQFFIRITRLGNLLEDTLGDINMLGLSIKYRRNLV